MRGLRFKSLVVLALAGAATGVSIWRLVPHSPAKNPSDPADPELMEAKRLGADADADADAGPHQVPLPARDIAEVIVLTDLPEKRIDERLARPRDFAQAPACGDPETCASVAAFLTSTEFRAERRPRGEIQLPFAEVMDEIAPTLSPADRARALQATWAVTLHAGAQRSPHDLPLRAVFAAGSAFGKMDKSASTWIYDVANRRIESGADFVRRADVPTNFSTGLLRADRLYIHRYDDPEPDAGGAVRTRLLTLGLKAFALPDLTIGPCAPADAPALAGFLADVATVLAAAPGPNVPLPLTVDGVRVELQKPPRREGDPENLLYAVTPADAEADLATLAKTKTNAPERTEDAERAAIDRSTAHAVATLPGALAAWKKAPGSTLQVAAPFRNADAGPDSPREFMWLTVDAADAAALTGRLANQPEIVTSLTAGSEVHVARQEVFDWLLRLPDGTTRESKTETVTRSR